jgi:hypothetical protein
VIEVLKICYAHDVPVTTRGAGTGNYGQAIPLAGGCVMHLNLMTNIKEIHPGRVICEPGCLLKDIDAATKAHSGQEIRLFSSTWATASIGGFIAGGSGGVGGIRWGGLRDVGNIIRLRVVTMEAEPRILEFTGEELHRVSHAYGTNGIITEVEMPLAPAYDWVDLFVTFKDFKEALTYAYDLASCDGLLLKLCTVFEAPIAKDYFQRVAPYVEPDDVVLALMVAPHAMSGFHTFTRGYPNAKLIYRSDDHQLGAQPGAHLRIHVEPHDAQGAQGRPVDHLSASRLRHRRPHRSDRKDPRHVLARGPATRRGDAPRRTDRHGRPQPRQIHHRGTAGRDRGNARGRRGDDLQPAPLHARRRRAAEHRPAAA